VYVGRIMPGYERANEADHMSEVREVFFDLHAAILNHESKTISVSMGADRAPLFGPAPESSKITITPARAVKRFEPVADAYVDEANSDNNYGSDNLLWVRSDAGNNRRTYLEFDLTTELENIYSGDVEKAWLVLYCENVSKFQGYPWGDSSETVDKWEYMPTLPVLIEVRQVTPDWSEETIDWDTQPSLEETIEAVDWPNEDNHAATENEVWYTWDVTAWVHDRMRAGENVSFLLKAVYENSTQNRYATFSSSDRTGLGWSWSVAEGKDNTYPDPHLPPYPKPHLTVIYENRDEDGRVVPGAPVFDNWGAFIEGGTIRFDTNYRNFPIHNFTFESGALVQEQWGTAYKLMIADPGLVVGERREDNDINVYVNRYRIVNRDQFTSSTDVRLRVRVWENTDLRREEHLENVLITINTDFEWPWKYYLRDLTGAGKGFNVGEWEGGLKAYIDEGWGDQSHATADFMSKFYVDRNVRMYIFGLHWGPNVNDIHYYERTYDVEVKVVV